MTQCVFDLSLADPSKVTDSIQSLVLSFNSKAVIMSESWSKFGHHLHISTNYLSKNQSLAGKSPLISQTFS